MSGMGLSDKIAMDCGCVIHRNGTRIWCAACGAAQPRLGDAEIVDPPESAPSLLDACYKWRKLYNMRPLDSGADMQQILEECFEFSEAAILIAEGAAEDALAVAKARGNLVRQRSREAIEALRHMTEGVGMDEVNSGCWGNYFILVDRIDVECILDDLKED